MTPRYTGRVTRDRRRAAASPYRIPAKLDSKANEVDDGDLLPCVIVLWVVVMWALVAILGR